MIGARAIIVAAASLACAACSKSDAPPPPPSSRATPAAAAASAADACPATGQWAECSLIYRLDRSGLAPHVDSSASPTEKALSVKPVITKIGQVSVLELFIYPDSNARIADEKKLDRTQLIGATDEQTIKRERTLIESDNVIGLLTSLNNHQRERVSDALTAGPPQPHKP